ncbi:hypothetical protein R1sor_002002 [Riccia sorocarpa]|uniref:Uncharacterized protein n=1 Tax=Riccia sorocarpa TaxID=122646 RepID=A0ABD3H0X4_9MARC
MNVGKMAQGKETDNVDENCKDIPGYLTLDQGIQILFWDNKVRAGEMQNSTATRSENGKPGGPDYGARRFIIGRRSGSGAFYSADTSQEAVEKVGTQNTQLAADTTTQRKHLSIHSGTVNGWQEEYTTGKKVE